MTYPAFVGERVLIAEDEPLISMELQALFEHEGATVFSTFKVSKAVQIVGKTSISAGLVDIRLGGEIADPVCEALDQRQVPFVFYTGAPETPQKRWPTVPIIGKPATAAAIEVR